MMAGKENNSRKDMKQLAPMALRRQRRLRGRHRKQQAVAHPQH